MRCRDCGQRWHVDRVDPHGVALAIKLDAEKEPWSDSAERAARVRYLERTWGLASAGTCIWHECARRPLAGIAYCAEHAYDHGVRARADRA
jgi:hypothetical protein